MKYGELIPKLIKGNVALCPIRTDDEMIPVYLKWLNNSKIAHYVGHNGHTIGFLDEKEVLNKEFKEGNNFNIVDIQTNDIVGNCCINRYKESANFEVGILIGEENYQNKGYGTIAVQLMIDFAFNECNAHRIYLSVAAENLRAIKCYEKCGFKEYGRSHQCRYHNGQWLDLIHMEIIKQPQD